jgi:hypothetical protein
MEIHCTTLINEILGIVLFPTHTQRYTIIFWKKCIDAEVLEYGIINKINMYRVTKIRK